eukprot:g13946.t1
MKATMTEITPTTKGVGSQAGCCSEGKLSGAGDEVPRTGAGVGAGEEDAGGGAGAAAVTRGSGLVPLTAADAAAAVGFDPQADYLEVQEAAFCTERGCKVVDLKRVLVGPELVTFESKKSVSAMKFALFPLLQAHPQSPERPELADFVAQGHANGGNEATQTQAAARLMLAAVIEFLPATAMPSRKRGVQDLTAAMDSIVPAEEGGGKRLASKAAGGELGAGETSALYEMSSGAKWKAAYVRSANMAPQLPKAREWGTPACARLLEAAKREVTMLTTISGRDTTRFKREHKFADQLMVVFEETRSVGDPVLGCRVLHMERGVGRRPRASA